MEINNIPFGFRFRPTDAELIRHYLLRRVLGSPLPSQVVKDCDLYGNKEPWEIWEEFSADVTEYVADNGVERDENCLYFFTRLKKKSDKRYDRTVGSSGGTWHGETVVTRIGNCGSRKMFTYKKKNGTMTNEFHWRMQEFSLNPEGFSPRLPKVDNNDIVLCRIIRDTKKRKTGKENPTLEGSLADKYPRLPENEPPLILQENYQPAVELQSWGIDENQPVSDSGHAFNHQPEPQVYDDNNFGEMSTELGDLPLMRTPTRSDYHWDGIFGHELFSDINIDGLILAPAIGIQTLADPVSQFHQQPEPHQSELQMEAQMWMIEAPLMPISCHFDGIYGDGLSSDLDRMFQGMLTPTDPISEFHPQPQPQLHDQRHQLALQMEPQIPMIQAPTPSDHRNMIESFGDGLRSDSNTLLQGTTAVIQTPDPVSQFHQQLQPQPQQTGLQMEPQMRMTDDPTPSDSWNGCFGDRTFPYVDRTLQMPTVRIRSPGDPGRRCQPQTRPQQMVPP